jgi:diguanylate cyclase (GGDEF)-like protein
MKVKNKNLFFRYLVSISIVSLLIFVGLFFVEYSAERSTIERTVEADLRAYSINIDNQVASMAMSIFLLEDIVLNDDSLVLDNEHLTFKSIESKETLQNDMYAWIDNQSIFDQARIIDIEGHEIVRVNYNNGDPSIVADEDLQDKSDRYYFINSIGMEPDELYFSVLDLNIENGEIEYVDGEPKVMLRVAKTIFNEDGEQLGLLIVNYLADILFDDEETYEGEFSSFDVINNDGYYLHSLYEVKLFGFMYEDEESLKETYSNYYNFDVSEIDFSGIEQVTVNTSFFTAYKIDSVSLSETIMSSDFDSYGVINDNGPIYIITHVNLLDTDTIQSMLWRYAVIGIITIVLIFAVSKLLDEMNYAKKQSLLVLEYTATHDGLTGVLNRQEITKKMNYFLSRKEPFCILFIDLDYFKEVNDTFGHNVGDAVLTEVAKRLKLMVRETDYVARLGGDEFLVVLHNNSSKSVLIEKKIALEKEIKKPIIVGEHTCFIGASIGTTRSDGSKSLEALLHEGDSAMYEQKKINKKRT